MDFLTTNPFALIFGVLAIACAIIVYLNNRNDTIPTVTNEFKKFQFQYLFVYFMALAADWLQGPYFYAIYASYNFEIGEIGFLFVVGFGSSMIFGTVVGSIADKYGRKNICLLFCVMYSTSCILINFPNWYLLLVGRLLGGISTSILFSTFEAWMIYEHFHRGFADDWLDYTFYLQVFGNGLIAIGAGLLGSFVKSTFDSYGAPFITAVGFLIVALVGIVVMWSENYGNQSGNATANFIQAFKTIQTDFKCFCLGVAQSLFEAAMYTFVFMWTPTLEKFFTGIELPHGLIFSAFMVAVMIGGSLFKLLTKWSKIEDTMVGVFAVSSAALAYPILAKENGYLVLAAFLVYETCVGMFWPSVGKLRSKYIPEQVRSTVMNYFRIPTNFFVLLVLAKVQYFSMPVVFAICVCLLTMSLIAQYQLV